jgi:hypothetical protein
MFEFEKLIPGLLLGLFTVIVTSAVTLLSVYLTNRGHHQRAKNEFERKTKGDQNKFLRERIEELYLLFHNWESDLIRTYIIFIPVLSGRLKELEAWDIVNKNNHSKQGSFQRIDMIVNMYFPQLKSNISSVLEVRDNASIYLTNKTRPKNNNEEKFIKLQQQLDSRARAFLEEIANVSRTL